MHVCRSSSRYRTTIARLTALALVACTAPVVHFWSADAHHDRISDPAPRTTEARLPTGLDLDPSAVTVSGLSSGAFFAHQFHIAYSALVAGVGIIAGGPYGCTEIIEHPLRPSSRLDQVSAAVVACTHFYGSRYWGLRPRPPSAERVLSLIADAARQGAIDDPRHLVADRVWLFHGARDRVVPAAVAAVLGEVYRGLGVTGPHLHIAQGDPARPASHGMPVERFTGESRFPRRACSEHAAPFIIECGFDAAGSLLRHLYSEGFSDASADPHAAGTLAAFSQTEFLDARSSSGSLSRVGYIYVPAECRGARCRLHVAFHGCRQNVDAQGSGRIHDDFVRDAGYNRWAAGNRIVVLYPQMTESAVNPNACWDFWAYSGSEYRSRQGPQMRAVRAMVARLLGSE